MSDGEEKSVEFFKDVEMEPLDNLIPYHNNPKQHPEGQVQKIASSIKEYGFTVPVLAAGDGEIIAGHGRIKAAKKLGLEEVPVIRRDDLTDAQIKAFRIMDNRAAESGWDYDKLGAEVERLDEMDLGFDLEMTGFDMEEIEDMDFLSPDPDEVDEEPVPEKPEDPTTNKGDLWKLGDHRLFCGDATDEEDVERLIDGEQVDMVFTDPPYGLGGYGGRKGMDLKGDDQDVAKFYDCIPEAPESYIWGNYKNLIEHVPEPDELIVWVKNNFGLGAGYRCQKELCFYYGNFDGSDSDVWEVDKDTDYDHPTQKPTKLASRAMKNSSSEGGLCLICLVVLDRRSSPLNK